MACRFALLVLSAALVRTLTASASDGRIEIDQARALAGGLSPADTPGFPVVITSSGSYVLTSDLFVAGGTTAIRIDADGVFLDLNGFAVRGTHVCSPVTCTFGGAVGIEGGVGMTGPLGNRVTVIDGEVSGFGQECIRLAAGAHLERLVIRSCGGDGIFAQEQSIALANRISASGRFGLRLINPSAFSNNVLAFNDLGAGAGGPFAGGVSGGGNVCDLEACAPAPKRRFYVTALTFNGATADNAGNCAPGFHFASLFELHDTTNLEYDGVLGVVNADSGEGPTGNVGWIRTGRPASVVAGFPGQSNCNAWTSSSMGDFGTIAGPTAIPTWTAPAIASSPWLANESQCSANFYGIWCVED